MPVLGVVEGDQSLQRAITLALKDRVPPPLYEVATEGGDVLLHTGLLGTLALCAGNHLRSPHNA